MDRQPALDGLRGVAVLFVLVIHAGTTLRTDTAVEASIRAVTEWAWIGVDLFFALSGFLITRSLLDTRASPNYFSGFYGRRVLRIFPLYYGAILIGAGLLHLRGTDSPLWLVLFASNWELLFHPANPYFLHFWSLAVEEHYYLVWPSVVRLMKPRMLMAACVAVAGASAGLRIAQVWKPVYAHVLTATRLDAIAFGSLLAAAMFDKRVAPAARRALVPLAWLSAGILAVIAFSGHGLNRYDALVMNVGYSAVALFAACVTGIAAMGQGAVARILSAPVLCSTGKISYGLYVANWPLIATAGPWMRHWADGRSIAMRLLIMLVCNVGLVAVNFAIALASWRFYESPILALKQRFRAKSRCDDRPMMLT